jgi:triacylglycerol lipase
MITFFTRCRALAATLGAALLAACAATPPGEALPPIVFVHGNGDSAALWHTTMWRFESNGWPRARMHAIDMPYPLARDNDEFAQEGRSSTTEHMEFLKAEVDKVLAATGARKVVLVANSRGGNAVRNYIANGGGAAKVSHAVLGGAPNHGVWTIPGFGPKSEFNGSGPFLKALNNQGAPGAEITPGPQWMTIRSDNNDKFAQPEGTWIGLRDTPTGVGFDGPELKGAKNLVLPGVDHRETSFSPQAFAATYEFITGKPPATTAITPQAAVVLDGQLTGLGLANAPGKGNYVNNLPLVGAALEIYATNPATGERLGAAVHRRSIGTDGRWGPFAADPRAAYEFVITAAGFSTTHIYRSPFPRSSDVVHLRAARLAEADRDVAAVVVMMRPRGYFGVPRDSISLDGASPPAGVPKGTAGVSDARVRLLTGAGRAVVGEFNGERIVGHAWPTAENRVVQLELHQ